MTQWTVAHQDHLSIGLPRQEYWGAWIFPSPGDLPTQESNRFSCIGRWILYHWAAREALVIFPYDVNYVEVCACMYAQSCPTVCDPMNCSPPDSTDHEIFQARILKWVAISFSSWSSQPRDQTCISYIDRWILYLWANREDLVITLSSVQSLSHVRLFATPWTAQPTTFLRPWDFPGKSTGVGCHCLLRLFSYTNLIMLRCVHACILSDVRQFVTPWTVAYQAPLSVGFFRQEYWSGFPSPGDIPNPGIEPNSCVSTALTDRFFITAPLSKQGSFLLFPVCWVLFIF